MRIVADTNVLVSALLWTGAPHELLVVAETHGVSLYTSHALLEELTGVLSRQKFSARLRARDMTVEEVIAGYTKLAHVVLPDAIPPVIIQDPADDHVLACAATAGAAYIISGDPHLLKLKRYASSHILSPRAFLNALR
jgi:putative PIN family toxin of toxin-antitoxin system